MAISKSDVKLLKSQRLTDEDDGGGRATGVAVVDGEVNNLEPDISRLDRTTGRINLRKAFAGVLTDNADAYLGAHAIVTHAPDDPRVSVVLFNTGSQVDERKAAQASIENYVVPSVRAPMELLGNQLSGQRAIICVQREEHRIPEVGEVYQLVDGTTASQYVRITSVDATMENFIYEYASGQFLTLPRRRLVLGIAFPLLATYPGGSVTPAGTADKNLSGLTKATVLSTQVADAARYFGLSPLAVAVSEGDMTLKVQSVYSQLVPSTVKETALVNQLGGYNRRRLVESGASRQVTLTFATVVSGQSRSYIGMAVAPKSVTLSISGGVYSDNGKGEFGFVSGSNAFTKITIDYQTGEINAYRATTYTGSATATHTPAASVTGPAVTGEIEINLGTRGYAHTLNLAGAKPRPGTLTISYMALGKWQDITDPGDGELTGAGSGTVDFATGAVSFTVLALPDVDSRIIYSYVAVSAAEFTQRTGVGAGVAKIKRQLPHGLKPGTVSVSYYVSGAEKIIADSGDGQMGGTGGSGAVNYSAGTLALQLTSTPDAGSSLVYTFEQGGTHVYSAGFTSDAGGFITGVIPGAPLKPGTVSASWLVTQRKSIGNESVGQSYDSTVVVERSSTDNGTGGWTGDYGGAGGGSIDYATGEFSMRVRGLYEYTERVYVREPDGLLGKTKIVEHTTTVEYMEQYSSVMTVEYQKADAIYGQQTETQNAPELTFDLLPTVRDPIVPGSLLLSWGGKTYVDREGVLYADISTSTNAGTAVGTVDYAAGEATLAVYPAGKAPSIDLQACLTSNAGFGVTALTFRTPGAPLRPASLQLTVVRADTAEVVTAAADNNGNFIGPLVYGTVDNATGVASLRFTDDVEDQSGASDVAVIPQLVKYNAVLYTSLPLNADLIGLDPVRLPADGRVPIYREGDVLVIHHSAETSVASPQAGGTVQLARASQASIEVVDADGVALAAAQYSVDRELGAVTWANPLLLQDASGNPLSLPLTIRDRVEHMTLCTEVQITGALGISSPLPWDLPAGEAMVSSALAWGDLQARLYRWYSQKTWNAGVPNWTDSPIGDATTSNYNSLNYPQVVTNRGAIAGKWAIVFTSATAFQVVEEKLGVITTGTISSDLAPINPATGAPYFTILAAGWGSGWAAGNAVRFNTDSCLGPLWVVRTVLSGQGTVDDDHFRVQIRGDAD